MLPDDHSHSHGYITLLQARLGRSSLQSTYDLFLKDGYLWLGNNAQGPRATVPPLLWGKGPFARATVSQGKPGTRAQPIATVATLHEGERH